MRVKHVRLHLTPAGFASLPLATAYAAALGGSLPATSADVLVNAHTGFPAMAAIMALLPHTCTLRLIMLGGVARSKQSQEQALAVVVQHCAQLTELRISLPNSAMQGRTAGVLTRRGSWRRCTG